MVVLSYRSRIRWDRLLASKGHFMTGVSTDIGTSFVRPAGRVGDTLHAKAVLTEMGGAVTASL